MLEYVGQDLDILPLVPDHLIQATIPHVQSSYLSLASEISPQRQILVRALNHTLDYLRIPNLRNIKSNGTMMLTLEGCKEDIDGLVGRGQALLEKEEWEDAVTTLEKPLRVVDVVIGR